jgi:hypothetical protein
MRSLTPTETSFVSGGELEGGYPLPDFKNNNGYGNGAEDGPPPGRSGAHNTQLLDDNRGPRGDR